MEADNWQWPTVTTVFDHTLNIILVNLFLLVVITVTAQ